MRADPTAAWAISKWDANDVIVSGLEPGESILGAAKMLIGHWSSRDLLKSGAAQIHPPLVALCVTDVGLREYAVERKLNRCTGECLLSIRFGQIAASDSQVGRYLSVARFQSPLLATRSPHPSERMFSSWPA